MTRLHLTTGVIVIEQHPGHDKDQRSRMVFIIRYLPTHLIDALLEVMMEEEPAAAGLDATTDAQD